MWYDWYVATVYLETSFFSACVTTRTSDQAKGWRASSLQWWEKEARRHELFISTAVLFELSARSYAHSEQALAMVKGLKDLEVTAEVLGLSEILVREKVMPAPMGSGDALHVALATYHRMDYILTWNHAHLANPRKRVHLVTICMRLGLTPPDIVTPDILQEPSDEQRSVL